MQHQRMISRMKILNMTEGTNDDHEDFREDKSESSDDTGGGFQYVNENCTTRSGRNVMAPRKFRLNLNICVIIFNWILN